MLLQKTGSRIKHFINHKRKNSYDDFSEDSLGDRLTDERLSTISARRMSWMSQSSPPIALILQRFDEGASFRRRPPISMAVSARSSLSSLCSCECDLMTTTSFVQQEPASTMSLTLCSDHRQTASQKANQAYTRWNIFPEQFKELPPQSPSETKIPSSSSRKNQSGQTFDLIEALCMDPVEFDSTPRPSASKDENLKWRYSNNVNQLIREADAAFGASADAPAFGVYGSSSPKLDSSAITKSHQATSKRLTPPTTAPNTSPTRSTTAPKAKRKSTFPKVRFLNKPVKEVQPTLTDTPSRWTLTDATATMADALNGKMFRAEVEEMRVDERVPQHLDTLDLECGPVSPQVSLSQGSDTDGSTPTEPFHLEYLSASFKSASKDSSIVSGPTLLPSIFSESDLTLNSPHTTTASSARFAIINKGDDDRMTFNDLDFPSPPRSLSTNWSVQSPPCTPTYFLPTIPEISPLMHILPRFSPRRRPCRVSSTHPVSPFPSSSVFLRASKYTMIAPSWRQGLIRVERGVRESARMDAGQRERQSQQKTGGKVLNQEELHCAAFHITISATNDAGADFARRSSDSETQNEEVDLRDLEHWWDTLDSGSLGHLDRGDTFPTPPSTASSLGLEANVHPTDELQEPLDVRFSASVPISQQLISSNASLSNADREQFING